MPKVRLGVALVVPPPFDREIDVLRRSLRDGALERIMPHVTLVSPVNVNVEDLDEVTKILMEASRVTDPFTVTVGPVATFAPLNPVLYLEVGPHEAIENLRALVFRGPLTKDEEHGFVPHVTICDEANDEQLAAAPAVLAGSSFEMTFSGVSLLQKDSGKPWERIGEFSFEPDRVVGRGGLPITIDVSDVTNPRANAFAKREWKPWLNTQLGPDRLEYEPLVITAEREGEIVGLLRAELRPPTAFLHELLIGVEARGQGVASPLLAALDDVARSKGCADLRALILHHCEAEEYLRHKGWGDDTDLTYEQFGREMIRMLKPLQ